MIYDMKTLSNSELTIKVSPHGAELCSILHDGKEYLWQADPAFWKRHSPVLFPIVSWNSRAELPNDRFVRCKDWQEIDRLFENREITK